MLLGSLVFACNTARAEDRCEDKVSIEVQAAELRGEAGNFVPASSMNRIYYVLTECVPSYEALIAAQKKLIETQDTTIKTASVAISARNVHAEEERARAESWKQSYDDEHKKRVVEEERNDSILRSPIFWLAVGVAGGIGLTIGAAYAVKEARD